MFQSILNCTYLCGPDYSLLKGHPELKCMSRLRESGARIFIIEEEKHKESYDCVHFPKFST